MISRSQIIPLLLEASPSFTPQWEAFFKEWQGKDDVPLYLICGDLVRHISALRVEEKTSEISAIFQVIERLILEGEEDVSEMAVVGILEDLQNPALHRGTKPEQFVCYLGNQSRIYWMKLRDFWQLKPKLI